MWKGHLCGIPSHNQTWLARKPHHLVQWLLRFAPPSSSGIFQPRLSTGGQILPETTPRSVLLGPFHSHQSWIFQIPRHQVLRNSWQHRIAHRFNGSWWANPLANLVTSQQKWRSPNPRADPARISMWICTNRTSHYIENCYGLVAPGYPFPQAISPSWIGHPSISHAFFHDCTSTSIFYQYVVW